MQLKLFFIKLFITLSLVLSLTANATDIVIINNDDPGEGLNDTTPVALVPGNSATTRGGQYFNVFQAAANHWELRLDSSVDIRVNVSFEELVCNSSNATLGSAGPLSIMANFDNVPQQDTWYTIAQANSFAGRDLNTNRDDVSVRINSLLTGDPACLGGIKWWLGINSPAPNGTVSLYETVLHEIAHGLGFVSLVSESGVRFNGLNDAFMLNLYDASTQKAWSNMSDQERSNSARNNGNLVWLGSGANDNTADVTAGKNGGRLRLYAPSTYRPGSSVSHWDTALFPNELMEPFATEEYKFCATEQAFKDMGWRVFAQNICGASSPPPPTSPPPSNDRMNSIVSVLLLLLGDDEE